MVTTRHQPRKRFGQNFLQDQAVINAMLQAFHLKPTDHVIEIGPGLGALTRFLLQKLDRLTAIEIDTDLQVRLAAMPEAKDRLRLINQDVLSVDFQQFGSNLRLIGNLPYNISTPLIFHLLQDISLITDMHFMLQKEVVERLAAVPGNKAYGRLSVMVQYYCQVDYLLDVPPTAFYPQPKVDSAVVRLTPHHPFPYPRVDFSDLEKLVACAFSMRRKTLANNLKPYISPAAITALHIDPKLRPEQLTILDFVKLANIFSK